ncbi:MAG: fused MFS/spermidine synthase [Spirochaetales bacterium]|nr:fused MFS/spermidine synthase [Spirochaetales bacterium]
MKKKKEQSRSLVIPCITVCLSSACIMIMEIVAGRLLARYLGATLYVWTSVIGVVLGGITLGNYIGGRLADKYPPQKTLAVLFAFSSAACVLIIAANAGIGAWRWLWQFPWPLRVFLHVAGVFFIPSALLGTISPVVAKTALDRGHPKGRTLGIVYAWSAGGSIIGTFLAGFFLISWLGTHTIVWMTGGVLLAAGILYWYKFWGLYVWAGVFFIFLFFGNTGSSWAAAGIFLSLREVKNDNILYEDESDYCYIAVERISENPDIRTFTQDDLKTHSKINMDAPDDLQFVYTKIFAAAASMVSNSRTPLSFLSIGGGGYVFPRYLAARYPGSRIDVVEIDPAVTKAAKTAFGFSEGSGIATVTMDARHYINALLEGAVLANTHVSYDVVFGDAFGASFIPFQLVTKECNDALADILSPQGLYVVNIPDVYPKGRLLGSYVHTMRQTFPYVYVVSEYKTYFTGRNFVVIGSGQKLDIIRLKTDQELDDVDLWILANDEIARTRYGNLILTDDYAPVDMLEGPFFMVRSRTAAAGEMIRKADRLKETGNITSSIAALNAAISRCPELSIPIYDRIGEIYAEIEEWDGVVRAGKSAIAYNEQADVHIDVSDIHYNIGVILFNEGNYRESFDHLKKAIAGYNILMEKNPGSIDLLSKLGNALAYTGDYGAAAVMFSRAKTIDAYDPDIRLLLVSVYIEQGKLREAENELENAIGFFEKAKMEEGVRRIKEYRTNLSGLTR